MINEKKVVVVLPAFNAERTLKKTIDEIPLNIVDEIIVVDDASVDRTVTVAESLGIKHIICHERNKGYGANQKTCYQKALSLAADVVIMLHPDYQYTPKLIPAMASLVAENIFPVVLGSRILGNGALIGGMPLYKYISNRLLTFFQNCLLGQRLSEYHTGYRAYSRKVLESIHYEICSDDFIFDNQILSQIIYHGFEIGEVTCPTKYFKEASSINFKRSIWYGLGVIKTSILYFLQKKTFLSFSIYTNKK